jgi:hypothetical protein
VKLRRGSLGAGLVMKLRRVLPDRNEPRWLLLGLVIALLATIWFGRNHHEALMGDDLILLQQSRQPGGSAHSFFDSFVDVTSDKWRPLLTPAQSILTRAFDGSYQAWVHLLTVLEWLNVMAATALAWLLSGRRWLVASIFAVALITSRFNNYFVWQTFGLMEGLALSATIACIAAARLAWRTGSRRWLAATIVASAAAGLIHERYLCLVVFVALLALLMPAQMRLFERLGWVGGALLVPLSNYVVKIHVLHVDFFAGAAGLDVHPTLSSVLGFLGDGVASLAGYNLGPSHLTGADARTLGLLPKLLTAIFVACVLAIVIAAIVRDARRGARWLVPWLLGPALLVPLLVVASISVRQEHRWLYTPQIVLLLGVAWAAGRAQGLTWTAGRAARALPTTAVLATALLASAAVDLIYARHVDDVYFMTGQRMADSVLDRVVDQHRTELATTTVFLMSVDPVFRDFYLAGGWFFRYYGAGTNPDVRFVAPGANIARAKDVRPNRLVFRVEGDQVVEVPVAVPTPGAGVAGATPRRRRAGG